MKTTIMGYIGFTLRLYWDSGKMKTTTMALYRGYIEVILR